MILLWCLYFFIESNDHWAIRDVKSPKLKSTSKEQIR